MSVLYPQNLLQLKTPAGSTRTNPQAAAIIGSSCLSHWLSLVSIARTSLLPLPFLPYLHASIIKLGGAPKSGFFFSDLVDLEPAGAINQVDTPRTLGSHSPPWGIGLGEGCQRSARRARRSPRRRPRMEAVPKDVGGETPAIRL